MFSLFIIRLLPCNHPLPKNKISISEVNENLDDYGGFIHTTRYDPDSLNQCDLEVKDKIGQHRSYIGYRSVEYGTDEVFSYVHGNF